jgi:hypothetical protein
MNMVFREFEALVEPLNNADQDSVDLVTHLGAIGLETVPTPVTLVTPGSVSMGKA